MRNHGGIHLLIAGMIAFLSMGMLQPCWRPRPNRSSKLSPAMVLRTALSRRCGLPRKPNYLRSGRRRGQANCKVGLCRFSWN